jgi:hypothetical protein
MIAAADHEGAAADPAAVSSEILRFASIHFKPRGLILAASFLRVSRKWA